MIRVFFASSCITRLTVDAGSDSFAVVSTESVRTSTLPAVLWILVSVALARPRQTNAVGLANVCTVVRHPTDIFRDAKVKCGAIKSRIIYSQSNVTML